MCAISWVVHSPVFTFQIRTVLSSDPLASRQSPSDSSTLILSKWSVIVCSHFNELPLREKTTIEKSLQLMTTRRLSIGTHADRPSRSSNLLPVLRSRTTIRWSCVPHASMPSSSSHKERIGSVWPVGTDNKKWPMCTLPPKSSLANRSELSASMQVIHELKAPLIFRRCHLPPLQLYMLIELLWPVANMWLWSGSSELMESEE